MTSLEETAVTVKEKETITVIYLGAGCLRNTQTWNLHLSTSDWQWREIPMLAQITLGKDSNALQWGGEKLG